MRVRVSCWIRSSRPEEGGNQLRKFWAASSFCCSAVSTWLGLGLGFGFGLGLGFGFGLVSTSSQPLSRTGHTGLTGKE